MDRSSQQKEVNTSLPSWRCSWRSTRCALLAAGRVIVCLSMLGLGACDTVKAPATPAWDPLPAHAYPQIVLHDKLDRLLVKEQPIVHPATEIRPMRVQVPIRSVLGSTLRLRFRFVFYGPDREVLSENPVWRAMVIPPRVRRYVSAQAIQLRATDWELEIKRR